MSSDGDNAQDLVGGNVMSEQIHEVDSRVCTAINENTGDICGEIEGLRILDQFRQIYEARMEKIERDEAAGIAADFIALKLSVMKEWIKDLGEQNVMLVRTVKELEQAACYRVKVLEGKLRETAGIVAEKMSRLTKPSEETVNCLSSRINQLEREEEILQDKITELKSDIRGLLELIRRARCENRWSIEGISFYGVGPDEIAPLPECSCTEEIGENESVESLKRQLQVFSDNERKARKYQAELEDKVSDLDNKLTSREETLKKYISMLESLRDNLKKRSTRNNQTNFQTSLHSSNDLEFDIAAIVEMVESAIATKREESRGDDTEGEQGEKRNVKNDEVEELRAKLQEKTLEMERLSCRLRFLEKESLETREALTNEVAEKHDMGMALRAEVATLEEQCRRANMLMQFKEDIIKDMRRELKQRSSMKLPFSSTEPLEKSKPSAVISPRHSRWNVYKKIGVVPCPQPGSPRHRDLEKILRRYMNEKEAIEIRPLDIVESKAKSNVERSKTIRDTDRKILRYSSKLSPRAKKRARKERSKNTISRPAPSKDVCQIESA